MVTCIEPRGPSRLIHAIITQKCVAVSVQSLIKYTPVRSSLVVTLHLPIRSVCPFFAALLHRIVMLRYLLSILGRIIFNLEVE